MVAMGTGNTGFFAVILVAILWVLREIAGLVFKRVAARVGKIGFVPKECGFFCEVETKEGTKVDSLFRPDNMFLDKQVLPLRITGDLYNSSETQVLFTNPVIRFVHPTGTKVTYKDPAVFVNGCEASTITVPAHGFSQLKIFVKIYRDALRDTYAQTIPFLNVSTVSGSTRSFRLSSVSFYGDPIAVWPREGKLPVFGPSFHSEEEGE